MTNNAETKVDRDGWGPGPWDSEPDRLEWRTEVGYPAIMRRVGYHGAWCGYVAVPPGHPMHGKASLADAADDLEVHGGVTYSGMCSGEVCHVPEPGEPDDVFWYGFDCAHCWDLCPGTQARLPPELRKRIDEEVYKDVAYVRAECGSLAKQLRDRA